MKYKIRYNKKDCIGAGECENIAPHRWKLNNEGRAELLHAQEVAPGIFEIEIGEEEYQKQSAVATSCPINCVELIKIK